MKLNFWQWVGVALIVVAIIVYFVWDRPQREEKKRQRESEGATLVEPSPFRPQHRAAAGDTLLPPPEPTTRTA